MGAQFPRTEFLELELRETGQNRRRFTQSSPGRAKGAALAIRTTARAFVIGPPSD
jgi:hypothetical protein